MNRSAAPGPVVPVLVYEDVAKAIGWLCEAFGFAERFRYGPEESPAGAQLAVGEGAVFLVGPRVSEWADRTAFRPPRPGELSHSVYVIDDDVDRHHEHAERSGARILHGPETYPFGERQYTAQDPGGHTWTFTQSVADVAPEEWGGTSARPRERGPNGPSPGAGGTRQSAPRNTIGGGLMGKDAGTGASVAPMLSVRNGARAVEFYESAFGAVEIYRVDDPGGAVVSRLSVDGAEFWLSDEAPEHGNFSPETLGGGTARMILTVPDPDAMFAKALAAGAREVSAVEEAYGWRVGRVIDPFGHHWEIGRPLAS